MTLAGKPVLGPKTDSKINKPQYSINFKKTKKKN